VLALPSLGVVCMPAVDLSTRLDAVTSADDAAGLVAAALGLGQTPDVVAGLGQTPDVVAGVCAALGRAPGLLVLDNLEVRPVKAGRWTRRHLRMQPGKTHARPTR
jgi:hypothetical protein